ncbi:MAG: DinB family protein [Candidatus Heimdallarchaeota archaeon]|nr:DinB family protein [Candidatus Heimdallarchaeota archaeon]
MSVSVEFLTRKYEQIVENRESLWVDLQRIPKDKNWLNQRLSSHQWSIDEVLRHMLGSEIRYVQQPVEPSMEQNKDAVMAQWVGNIFFRFEENDHMSLENLILAFDDAQRNTRRIMGNWNEDILNKLIEAPWREMIPYRNSVIHFLEHEISHMGQVQFMLTYFRGPPEFKSNWFDNQD